MSEALYASGGSYDAAEDRKLIRAIFFASGNGGVIRGMAVTPGIGLNVAIGGGFFVVNDTTSGSFLAYNVGSATVAIPGNTSGATRTDLVYASVNATTGAVTYARGATVPVGSIQLATVTVPNNAVTLAAGNVVSNPNTVDLGGLANGRYMQNDKPDTLYPGSNAYTPTDPNNVATKGYVDSTIAASTGFVNLFGQGATKFLIQAGTGVRYADGDSNSRQPFPVAFPNACVTVVSVPGDDAANPGWTMNPFGFDRTGFSYRCWQAAPLVAARGLIHRINWVAIGY